jgi:hypothetical protein
MYILHTHYFKCHELTNTKFLSLTLFNMTKKLELLMPAGDMEKLKFAYAY